MTNKATPFSASREEALKNTNAVLGNNAAILGTASSAPPGRYVGLPKSVIQFDPLSCWAAATEAWLQLIPAQPNLTQDQLVGQFATNIQSGGLEPYCVKNDPNEKCFGNFANAVGMEYEDLVIDEVRTDYLIQKLGKGPVLAIFNTVVTTTPGGYYSHAVVVYGVGRPKGKNVEVSFMDPTDGAYHNLDIGAFHQLIAGSGATRRRSRPTWVTWNSAGEMIALVARIAWVR